MEAPKRHLGSSQFIMGKKTFLQTPGGTGDKCSTANPLEAGAVGGTLPQLPTTVSSASPGSSGATTISASPLEARVAINHLDKSTTTQNSFAKHLVISHSDRDDDICKMNPTAIQKAIEVLIGQDFECNRHEKAKHVEIHVRSKRASETLLSTTELDCTEFIVPVSIVKHRTKNTCKGVIHCASIGKTSKTQLLDQMAEYHVTEIFRLSRTEKGVTSPTNSYILTFNSETPPQRIDFGFGERVLVNKYYPNPRLCRNCQRYGHGANNCNNKQRCAKCGLEGHAFGDCDKETYCCYYCNENHPTSDKTCPRYKLEKRVLKQMTNDRSSPLEARKKVYRDSQDLVSLIPSLSSYVTTTYSKIVAGNSNVTPSNQRSQTQPSSQTTKTQQLNDPSSYFDHPLFKSMIDQQESLAKQQKDLLEQQKQNSTLMQNMMGIMGSMMGFLQTVFSQSIQPQPLNPQAIRHLEKLQSDLNVQQVCLNSTLDDSTTVEVLASSDKKLLSSSSDINENDQTVNLIPGGQLPPANITCRVDNSATPSEPSSENQAERPKTCSSITSSSDQNTPKGGNGSNVKPPAPTEQPATPSKGKKREADSGGSSPSSDDLSASTIKKSGPGRKKQQVDVNSKAHIKGVAKPTMVRTSYSKPNR